MKQADLINQVADMTGESRKLVEKVLKAAAKEIAEQLQAGGEATLPGLGKLSTTQRAARTGRNPKTGEEIAIPAKRVPHFSAAKALKDAVAE